jgi:hypothetical protein
VEIFTEAPAVAHATLYSILDMQGVGAAFAPRCVRNFGDDRAQLARRVVQQVEADRIEHIAEGAHMRQHMHRTERSLSMLTFDTVAGGLGQAGVVRCQIILTAKARQG